MKKNIKSLKESGYRKQYTQRNLRNKNRTNTKNFRNKRLVNKSIKYGGMESHSMGSTPKDMEIFLADQVSWENLSIDEKKKARQNGYNKSSWKRELEKKYQSPTNNNKYIFLDIDGVVHQANESGGYNSTTPILEKMPFIIELAKKTNAKIVISSNWRMRSSEMGKIKHKLETMGYNDEIDMLDNNYHTNMDGLLFLPDNEKINERSQHIVNYLQSHPPGNFVVIDDTRKHISPELMDNFVETKTEIGITKKDIEKAEKILN